MVDVDDLAWFFDGEGNEYPDETSDQLPGTEMPGIQVNFAPPGIHEGHFPYANSLALTLKLALALFLTLRDSRTVTL